MAQQTETAPKPHHHDEQQDKTETPRAQKLPNTPGGSSAQARLFDIVASMLAEATPLDDD